MFSQCGCKLHLVAVLPLVSSLGEQPGEGLLTTDGASVEGECQAGQAHGAF
jgi:hypothetical protein